MQISLVHCMSLLVVPIMNEVVSAILFQLHFIVVWKSFVFSFFNRFLQLLKSYSLIADFYVIKILNSIQFVRDNKVKCSNNEIYRLN